MTGNVKKGTRILWSWVATDLEITVIAGCMISDDLSLFHQKVLRVTENSYELNLIFLSTIALYDIIVEKQR